MRERHHRSARIGDQGADHGMNRVFLDDRFAGKARVTGKGLARIDHDQIIAAAARHRRQEPGDLDRPHDDQPQRRVKDGHDAAGAVLAAAVGAKARVDLGLIARADQLQPAIGVIDQRQWHTRRPGADQLLQQREWQRRADRQEQQPDRPAAAQPRRCRLRITDMERLDPGAALGQRLLCGKHKVRIDSRDAECSLTRAIRRDQHHTAGTSGRRAPALHDNHHHRATPGAMPVKCELRDQIRDQIGDLSRKLVMGGIGMKTFHS